MDLNHPTEPEPAPTEELNGTELLEQPSSEQDTQPLDTEAMAEITESGDAPAVSEPLPDPLGEELAEDLASQPPPELEGEQPEEEQVVETTTFPQETETPPATGTVASTQTSTEPKMITRTAAIWLAVGGMLISFIFAVLFSLGLLAIVNGGLLYVRPAQVENISGQLNSLNAQTTSIQREMDNLTARINTLEGLDARVAVVEKDAQLLQEDLNSAKTTLTNLNGQVGELRGQITSVESQIEELNTRTTRFQTFLDGLRDLLGGLSK